MPCYCYRTDDGEVVELFMSYAEQSRREHDDRIELEDGRSATRCYAAEVGRRCRCDVDHTSVALQVLNDDLGETLKEDKRINPNSAPNEYDAEGIPHWKGEAISVRQRVRQYCRERGLAWKE